ncbi:hypothetical protein EhV156_00147 [Emiliania huxleyi virus 156]|nr:hypothetical protein EhV156_00147 [Emiliania huxleyi virus 156]
MAKKTKNRVYLAHLRLALLRFRRAVKDGYGRFGDLSRASCSHDILVRKAACSSSSERHIEAALCNTFYFSRAFGVEHRYVF